MSNPAKEKLLNGEPLMVINPDFPSPNMMEFLGGLGFDGVFIDCETGSTTLEGVAAMNNSAKVAGVCAIVRTDSDESWVISRYLSLGIDGVMVPHIHDVDTAKKVVETVQYSRSRDYQDKFVIALLESVEAMEQLPSILGVDGIDIFFIGTGDLSHTMGFPGQRKHPEVQAVVDRAIAQICGAGKIAGISVDTGDVADMLEKGVRFLYLHANLFLEAGAKQFIAKVNAK